MLAAMFSGRHTLSQDPHKAPSQSLACIFFPQLLLLLSITSLHFFHFFFIS
jgi:hypothetical protein